LGFACASTALAIKSRFFFNFHFSINCVKIFTKTMAQKSNYSEDKGYVNIYGHDVRVYVCEKTGQIVIPIDELKEMGFRLYKKSQYGKLLIDDNQFSKEFDMYMLQSAQTYMLENKITFKENDILESINKCKKMLTGGQNDTTMSTPTSNFKNHLVETTPACSITPNLKQSVTVQNENLDIHDHQFRGFTKKKKSRFGRLFV
jgi:hypothetical protein